MCVLHALYVCMVRCLVDIVHKVTLIGMIDIFTRRYIVENLRLLIRWYVGNVASDEPYWIKRWLMLCETCSMNYCIQPIEMSWLKLRNSVKKNYYIVDDMR